MSNKIRKKTWRLGVVHIQHRPLQFNHPLEQITLLSFNFVKSIYFKVHCEAVSQKSNVYFKFVRYRMYRQYVNNIFSLRL